MGTKIKLQSCFALSEMMILPEGVETISHLLRHIGGMIDFSFMDPESGDLEEDFEVIINGKEIWFYPTTLNTPLNEGDLVELYMVPLGGG